MIESAGILMFKMDQELKFLLVHPGGPFFSRKDAGYWTIPKGLPEVDEDFLSAAKREFFEETGHQPEGAFIELGTIIQKGGKRVHCWAVEGDFNVNGLVSNTFEVEWPPKSGVKKTFPEIDK